MSDLLFDTSQLSTTKKQPDDSWNAADFGETPFLLEENGQLTIFFDTSQEPPDPDDYKDLKDYENAWCEFNNVEKKPQVDAPCNQLVAPEQLPEAILEGDEVAPKWKAGSHRRGIVQKIDKDLALVDWTTHTGKISLDQLRLISKYKPETQVAPEQTSDEISEGDEVAPKEQAGSHRRGIVKSIYKNLALVDWTTHLGRTALEDIILITKAKVKIAPEQTPDQFFINDWTDNWVKNGQPSAPPPVHDFKVGDRVRITHHSNAIYNNCEEIIKTLDYHFYAHVYGVEFESGLTAIYGEFNKLDSTGAIVPNLPKHDFQVGDRVRIIKHCSGGDLFGHESIITILDCHFYKDVYGATLESGGIVPYSWLEKISNQESKAGEVEAISTPNSQSPIPNNREPGAEKFFVGQKVSLDPKRHPEFSGREGHITSCGYNLATISFPGEDCELSVRYRNILPVEEISPVKETEPIASATDSEFTSTYPTDLDLDIAPKKWQMTHKGFTGECLWVKQRKSGRFREYIIEITIRLHLRKISTIEVQTSDPKWSAKNEFCGWVDGHGLKFSRSDTCTKSSTDFVLEQTPTTTNLAPEQKFNQWVEEYPVIRGDKEYKYFRYCYMGSKDRKIHHHHIRGGAKGKLAQERVEQIKQAIANGKTPAEIKAIIAEH
ncbi:MAG TPA: hypothetical protein VK203_27580 [Nostocaceae cyanobacterium]|nr:hypothetical protein [Nostocaceae cyanobacterium]